MPREITVRLHTYGTEQVRGRRARKVARRDVPYLERVGWTVARRVGGLSSYDRMYPPEGGDKKRPEICLTVPTDTEIRELASRLHAAGDPWRGELCGWPAKYTPRKLDRGQRTVLTIVGDGPRQQVEPYEYVDPARFEVSSVGAPWHAWVIWRDGDDGPPDFHAQTD